MNNLYYIRYILLYAYVGKMIYNDLDCLSDDSDYLFDVSIKKNFLGINMIKITGYEYPNPLILRSGVCLSIPGRTLPVIILGIIHHKKEDKYFIHFHPLKERVNRQLYWSSLICLNQPSKYRCIILTKERDLILNDAESGVDYINRHIGISLIEVDKPCDLTEKMVSAMDFINEIK